MVFQLPLSVRYVTLQSTEAEPPLDYVNDEAVLVGLRASIGVFRFYWRNILQDALCRFAQIATAQFCVQEAAVNPSDVMG